MERQQVSRDWITYGAGQDSWLGGIRADVSSAENDYRLLDFLSDCEVTSTGGGTVRCALFLSVVTDKRTV